jgi:hypothetical protein
MKRITKRVIQNDTNSRPPFPDGVATRGDSDDEEGPITHTKCTVGEKGETTKTGQGYKTF